MNTSLTGLLSTAITLLHNLAREHNTPRYKFFPGADTENLKSMANYHITCLF